jgi:hypothetical protein
MRKTLFQGLAVVASAGAAVLVCGFGQANAAPLQPSEHSSVQMMTVRADLGAHMASQSTGESGTVHSVDKPVVNATVVTAVGLNLTVNLGLGLTIGGSSSTGGGTTGLATERG